MITMEIKKLVDTKYGNKLAQIAFSTQVGLLTKSFMAWGFVPATAQVGDSADIENLDGMEFSEVDLGDGKKCRRVKLV